MRKLALFSFAFAAGAFCCLLTLPAVLLCALAACLLALLFLGIVLRGKKERIAAILAAGLLCGGLWAQGYSLLILRPAEAVAGEDLRFSVELTDYPAETDYGASVVGMIEVDGHRFRGILYLDDAGSYKPGDVLSGTGDLLAAKDNQENGSLYYRSIGIQLQAFLREDVETVSADKIPLRCWPAAVSHAVKGAISALFPEDVRGFLQALLTGDHHGLSYQDKSELQIAGVYHTMAVSGMHVSILMSILFLLTMKHRRIYPLLGLPILVFYCVMVGGAPSVVRAAIMQLFLMAAPVFRREPDAPTSLGTALLVLTLANPCSLQNVGLQLSFGATAGILGCSGRIYGMLTRRKGKRLVGLRIAAARITATTLGALLPTTPLMAYYFGTVSLLGVLTNVLVIGAVTLCFSLGLAAVASFFLWPALGAVLAAPVAWLMRYVLLVSRLIAGLPFAAVYPQTPYLVFWLLFVYGVLALLFLRRERLTGRLLLAVSGCAAVTLCACVWFGWAEGSSGEFVFSALDVGQGQCLLLRSEGYTAAMDCGGSRDDEAGELLARTLLTGGSTRLNYLILTHYDDDHTGGVRQLFSRVPVDVLLLPDIEDDSGIRQELETLASDCGTQVYYVTRDLTIPFGAGSLEIFAPVSDAGGNASCLSILSTFGDYDILVTGDLGISQEDRLLLLHELPDIELLVAGHHGSQYSTGEELLEATKPETVVISVGVNSYGHPAAETLYRIAAAGAETYRTDQSGTITVRR
ncbi:MAG: ComEC/Rec2 family competence protein [Oscillospiraceae bacterium]|nr:ComEC/Rec2 family competence protein [Oscillospiraceae bacterium]